MPDQTPDPASTNPPDLSSVANQAAASANAKEADGLLGNDDFTVNVPVTEGGTVASISDTEGTVHPNSVVSHPPQRPETTQWEGTTTPNPNDEAVADLLKRLGENKATPAEQAMIRHNVNVVSVTVSELQAAIRRYPDHPVAQVYAGAIRNLPATATVHIEQPDLQALLQNRKVKVNHDHIDGQVVRTKSVM